MALSLVAGIAVIDVAVLLVLVLGGGILGLKVAAGCLAAIGCYELVRSRGEIRRSLQLAMLGGADRWFAAVILAVAAINLVIAVAPSTKLDELHYHMLLPKRVLEDQGLYLYRQPYELAIFPQMAFQLGLSLLHAAGFPESGAVLSWALGLVLILLIVSVTGDLTGSSMAGWMTGALAAVGLYTSVWHVTSGPHALGDLATTMACLMALLPDHRIGPFKVGSKLAAISLACCTAASTKISLLPLAVALTLIGIVKAVPQIGWKKAGLIAW